LREGLSVLVVDNNSLVRTSVMAHLRHELAGVRLGEAGDGASALDLFHQTAWDVVLLDVSMPGESGPAVLANLLKLAPELPVVMCSSHTSQAVVAACLKRGARGYVVKQDADTELVPAIRGVLHGELYVSQHARRATGPSLTATTGPNALADARPIGNRILRRPFSAEQRAAIRQRAANNRQRAEALIQRARQVARLRWRCRRTC
jgi:DNA-binding NarL/FixJ family response regulator